MLDSVPPRVREYADQAVSYVRRALGIQLEYDSNTLPVLDHYLRNVPEGQPAALQLVVATSGAYFGEVVRQRLGGRWELADQEAEWRIVLPTGLNFSPVGFVAAAIARADLADLDSEIAAPPRMLPYVQRALARMGEVTIEDYYSLCGRLDTLEHVHEVLVAVAAQMLGDEEDDDVAVAAVVDPDAEDSDEDDDEVDDDEVDEDPLGDGAPEPVADDEASGPVN
ncbi:MAG TPA: hypothetical protein VHT91_06545 [Kofleriaceae bacterium]|jgi:hypothetical protein|nr:hypothetical protein [Kofleriaceae bacterium]